MINNNSNNYCYYDYAHANFILAHACNIIGTRNVVSRWRGFDFQLKPHAHSIVLYYYYATSANITDLVYDCYQFINTKLVSLSKQYKSEVDLAASNYLLQFECRSRAGRRGDIGSSTSSQNTNLTQQSMPDNIIEKNYLSKIKSITTTICQNHQIMKFVTLMSWLILQLQFIVAGHISTISDDFSKSDTGKKILWLTKYSIPTEYIFYLLADETDR